MGSVDGVVELIKKSLTDFGMGFTPISRNFLFVAGEVPVFVNVRDAGEVTQHGSVVRVELVTTLAHAVPKSMKLLDWMLESQTHGGFVRFGLSDEPAEEEIPALCLVAELMGQHLSSAEFLDVLVFFQIMASQYSEELVEEFGGVPPEVPGL